MAAWRAVLFCVDLATLLLLIRLLRTADVPVAYVAWYWWNPILLREVFGAGHMDVLAVPLVLATLKTFLQKHAARRLARRGPGWEWQSFTALSATTAAPFTCSRPKGKERACKSPFRVVIRPSPLHRKGPIIPGIRVEANEGLPKLLW